jgi:hypothetical protein
MSELGAPVLPATVIAAHLEACAADLAGGTTLRRVGGGLVDVHDLADVLRHLIAGQRHISATLGRLAGYLRDQHDAGPLSVVPSDDLAALTEVLRAAASATGYSADALAETAPLMDVVVESAGGDTLL